ncbi:proton-conducting transporter transmembrane domain-containing protein [Glycomyces xiaoerkulensis]|uniref:proton-conducting transporter transmembrane domain-containing protein n=1 Tax=Glycomyces xiaoerkulensis TaxID=2038139 RepID=UPI000C2624CE|nr:proton-conducting transporter membrane subunit [Glycomyces xiaoerkulensis]
MAAQTIDHAALLPLYLAAATAAVALFAGRAARAVLTAGLSASGAAALWLLAGPTRATFAVGERHSFVADDAAMGLAALFAGLTVLVAAVSGRRSAEYCFLLAVSAAGGITLAAGRDLITLLVAVETLTVPLYVLVAKPGRTGAEAGVTFLIASIASSATALMGAALLYAASGSVHLAGLGALADGHPGLAAAGTALLLGGLGFKLAAAPLHAWAPLVLERAPLPIAAYLASASKLGGAVAVIWVVHFGLAEGAGAAAGIVLAVLAVASIAVGNLGALAQRRTVGLLAWSGIAHAGYLLAPLGALSAAAGRDDAAGAASAALAYAVFFVLLEAGAFASLTAVRERDGGAIADLGGLWRTAPGAATVFLIAVIGLAGLPPALAGTFAKVAVLEWLASAAVWLAVVVVAGAVVGLAYYLRLARTVLLGRGAVSRRRFGLAVLAAGAALAAVSLAPQLVLEFTSLSR